MIAVTSLSLSRLERQQYCVHTWKQRGLRVIAVQSPGETEHLQQYFPNVTFKEYDLPETNMFSKNTPTIYSMYQQAIEEDSRILLINSDISIKDRYPVFNEKWKHQDNTLLIGIRLDGDKGSKRRTIQKWGIDAFALSQEMVQGMPNLNFRVGCPGWDFWIVYYFYKLGYTIANTKSRFLHENHITGWNRADQTAYRKMMSTTYGHAETVFLPTLILKVTNR